MRKKITLRGIAIFNFVNQDIEIKRINNDIAEKSEQLNEKKEENRKLQAELERVQSNYDYLEKLARERLGLIKEGEQIILPSEPQE